MNEIRGSLLWGGLARSLGYYGTPLFCRSVLVRKVDVDEVGGYWN